MTLEAKFKITAQLEQAIKALGTLKAEVTGVQAEASRASGGAAPFASVSEGAGKLGEKLAALRETVVQVATAVAGIELGRNTLAMIDAYNGLTARLRVTTGSQLAFNQAMEAARTLSSQYQTGLADTAKLLDRVYSSIAPLGGTLGNARTATEALLASLKISGATAEEASSAILQFSQALGKGVLNGDEFNSINEAAPGLLRALGTALGKSTADLKKMGEQGTLTSDVIIKAATIALPQLRDKAAAIGPTIGGSFTLVNNALTEFVGKAGQANGTAQIVGAAMKVLANNIGLVVNALGLLTAGIAITWVSRLATALPGLIGGIGGVGLAIRGVLGFLTGPVGLIVTLGSLALAWVGVDAAQRGAANRTLDAVKTQRDGVQKIVDTLNAKNDGDKASGTSTATFGRQASLERNLALLQQLDAEIASMEKKTTTAADSVDIRADGPLKAKLEENKGKRKLDEDYARDRQLIEEQSVKKIAALRAQGRDADASNLAVDAQQSLVQLKKTHDDAVKALTKDQTNTRIAQYVEEYDRIAELVADGTARELKTLQANYDNQLIATRTYFQQRGALEDEGKGEAVAKIEAEIAARQAVIDKNKSVRTNSVNDAAALAEANKRELEAINKLEVDRVKAQRDLRDGVRERALEETKATAELRRQRDDTDFQIKEGNDLVTIADERLHLQNQYADARKRELAETGNTDQTDQLIATQLRLAEVARLKASFGDLNQALVLQEQSLSDAVARGAITAEDAEKRKFAARAESLPQLQTMLDAMRALATTAGEKNAVEGLTQDLAKLRDTTTEFQKSAKEAGISALSSGLNEIATHSKSVKDGLLDIVSSFSKAMLELIEKRLATQLFDQFSSAASSFANSQGGGFLSTILGFFGFGGGGGTGSLASGSSLGSAGSGTGAIYAHTGAVIGGAGGWQQTVPSSVFAFAPRYHTGGIAGLRPNEVPAILEQGEEVITKSDPRHARNAGSASVGDVNISVQVSGAEGTADSQRGAVQKMTDQIKAVVLDWATTESRQGGMLARRA